MSDLVSQIMSYEVGELDDVGILNLFSGLIETGMAYTLQGSYGRMAHRLIEAGLLTNRGVITPYALREIDFEVAE